ncbi:MAG: PilN domain-containing protein [Saccharofermentans sp.]|nr:PilN domain-containing protein [Saccharofermentans sp.]
MANFGSAKGYSKKDLNFFAQFTAKARKQARVLAVVVLAALIVVGFFVLWTAWALFNNLRVKGQVDDLTIELQDPKYANLDIEAKNLEQEIIARNQYFYTISEMRRIVDETPSATTDLANLIGENIPNTTYISKYEITGTEMTIEGYTFNYYEASNITNMLQASDVFSDLNLTVEHVNRAENDPEDGSLLTINTYYSFIITGDLTVDSYISVSKVIDSELGVTAVGGVTTTPYATGSTYEIPDIGTLEVNGVSYQLSNVLVDGVAVTPDELSAIIANNSISGRAAGNMSIELHYTVVATDEAAEGGEE